MAKYDLKCIKCNKVFQIEQPMSYDLPKDCPKCNAKDSLKQIYQAAPVIFKGTGFYCKGDK